MIQPSGPAPARIMIVGEYPGEEEVRKGIPFVGEAGKELDRMLAEVGVARSTCFVTNVLRVRPPGNSLDNFIARAKKDVTPQHGLLRDKMCLPAVFEGVELLGQEVSMVKPNVIIALGNLAMWALTGQWGITSWRASLLQTDMKLGIDYQPKVVPTYHPSAIFRQLELRRIMVADLRRAVAQADRKELIRPDYKFIIRPSIDQVLDILGMLDAKRHAPFPLAVDIETRAGHIACIGLSWSKHEALCIPLMDSHHPEGYWSVEAEAHIHWRLYQLLTHPNCHVIGQNFLYDAQYFHRHLHFVPNLVRDTMLAQHVCFSNLPKSLDFLSSMYRTHHCYWKDDGKDWDQKTGEDQLWEYNCDDCVATFEVDAVLQEVVAKTGMQGPHDFQQKLFWPVLQTMQRGIRVDANARGQLAIELSDAIAEREQWICDLLGEPINIRSPLQMSKLFYETLGQRPIYNRKTGSLTCDDEALQKLASREILLRPLIKKIQQLRSLGVFLSTFINAPLDIDGRIRCSFNIGGTITFRFSSSQNAFGTGLNLQNIPAGGTVDELELPNIRKLFLPDPGHTFFDVDLSSADLRIVVWESDEREMKAMLREGLDPYTEIAKEFYHDPAIKKSDPRRQTFKSFAHGTHYLGTAKGLAERLGLSVHEAEKTQKWYFEKFPRIKKWQEDLVDQIFKRRMVQNVFGYRTYFFQRIEGTVINEAAAWIPQSTVACLINRGYMNLFNQHKDIEVLLQVHDSLAGQYQTHLGDDAKRRIIEACSVPLPYSDPLIIPVGIKTSQESWGACK